MAGRPRRKRRRKEYLARERAPKWPAHPDAWLVKQVVYRWAADHVEEVQAWLFELGYKHLTIDQIRDILTVRGAHKSVFEQDLGGGLLKPSIPISLTPVHRIRTALL